MWRKKLWLHLKTHTGSGKWAWNSSSDERCEQNELRADCGCPPVFEAEEWGIRFLHRAEQRPKVLAEVSKQYESRSNSQVSLNSSCLSAGCWFPLYTPEWAQLCFEFLFLRFSRAARSLREAWRTDGPGSSAPSVENSIFPHAEPIESSTGCVATKLAV